MDTVVLVLVGVVALGVVVKLSSSARTERKVVLARLAEEDDLRGPMPTELLFREVAPTTATRTVAALDADAAAPVAPTVPPTAAPSIAPAVAPNDLPTSPPDAPATATAVDPVAEAGTEGESPVSTDVGTFFAGIQLPADLVPWTGAPITDQEASFTTLTPAAQVLVELGTELGRLGIAATWDAASLEPGTAVTASLVRDGQLGSVTLHASAERAQDEQGTALFTGLLSGTTLVRLSV